MPPKGLKGKGADRSGIGAAIVIASQTATLAGIEPFATWNTPIAWWGYLLFLDGLIEYRSDRSFLLGHAREFWGLCVPVSIAAWTLFDLANAHLVRNWRYEGLPKSFVLRTLGFTASFATVIPGILLTAGALETFEVFKEVRSRPFRLPPAVPGLLIAAGLLLLAVPFLFPVPAACAALWLFAIFLLEPVNRRRGAPSLLRDLEEGTPARPLRLALAGLLCGFLWEGINFYARGRWVYEIPYLPPERIFEMPVLGYLGFVPFAWEVFAIYAFAVRAAGVERPWIRAGPFHRKRA